MPVHSHTYKLTGGSCKTTNAQNIQNHGFPLQHLPRSSCRDWAWPPVAGTFHLNWLSVVGFIGGCFVQSITTKVSKLVRFNTLTTVEHTKVSFADRVPALSSRTLPEKCEPCRPYPGMELFGTAHNDHMSPSAAVLPSKSLDMFGPWAQILAKMLQKQLIPRL